MQLNSNYKQGNKGGVAVRLRVHDSHFCFINSHLAAGSEELERRNSDFKDISKKLLFSEQNPGEDIKYSTIFDNEYESLFLLSFSFNLSLAHLHAHCDRHC